MLKKFLHSQRSL